MKLALYSSTRPRLLPWVGRRRPNILMGLVFAVVFASVTTAVAEASCAKKERLINSAVERLVDYANSSDSSQRDRDREVIRASAKAIPDEDCLGASREVSRLSGLFLSISLRLDAADDYGDESKPWLLKPIQLVIFEAADSTDTSQCRCYARRAALSAIFEEVFSLLDNFNGPLSQRERRAAFAWYKILDGYLFDTAGLHFRSLHTITTRDSRNAYLEANAQLTKHCGLDLGIAPPQPVDCKYTI